MSKIRVSSRQLNASHIQEASSILAHAFNNDPRFVWMVRPKDEQRRLTVLEKGFFPPLVKFFITHSNSVYGAFRGKELVGVAMWVPPGLL